MNRTDLPWVYRNYSLSTLTKDACANFLQDLAIAKGTITCSFTVGSPTNTKQARYTSMHFKLQFYKQEHVDKFHELGHNTTEPEKISGM